MRSVRSKPSAICGRGSQAFRRPAEWFGDLAKATLGEQKIAAQADTSGFKAAQEAYSAALNKAMSFPRR